MMHPTRFLLAAFALLAWTAATARPDDPAGCAIHGPVFLAGAIVLWMYQQIVAPPTPTSSLQDSQDMESLRRQLHDRDRKLSDQSAIIVNAEKRLKQSEAKTENLKTELHQGQAKKEQHQSKKEQGLQTEVERLKEQALREEERFRAELLQLKSKKEQEEQQYKEEKKQLERFEQKGKISIATKAFGSLVMVALLWAHGYLLRYLDPNAGTEAVQKGEGFMVWLLEPLPVDEIKAFLNNPLQKTSEMIAQSLSDPWKVVAAGLRARIIFCTLMYVPVFSNVTASLAETLGLPFLCDHPILGCKGYITYLPELMAQLAWFPCLLLPEAAHPLIFATLQLVLETVFALAFAFVLEMLADKMRAKAKKKIPEVVVLVRTKSQEKIAGLSKSKSRSLSSSSLTSQEPQSPSDARTPAKRKRHAEDKPTPEQPKEARRRL